MSIIDDLKRDEGLSLKLYKDTEGINTIGYGTNIEEIDKDEAEYLLIHRFEKIETETYNEFPWLYDKSDNIQDAVLNMAYNLGIPRLKGFKKMLGALEQGDYEIASNEALDSKWAEQVKDRAVRIAKLIRNH